MAGTAITLRRATDADLPAIERLMVRAIDMLQDGVLTAVQVVASHRVMGLDRSLVADGTYMIAEAGGVPAGCGGWSRRATLFGGDDGDVPRDARLLDPAREPARIRAMYTDPAWVRRGIGRAVLTASEGAASEAGFTRTELMATLAGVPLYRACGYTVIEPVNTDAGGVIVPMMRMIRLLE